MPDMRTILHPTDFSENSRYAFATACTLARENHATLIILHVMAPSVSPLANQPPDPRQSAESGESLARFPWPKPTDPSIRVEHRLAEGSPADEVLRLAAAISGDLIVIGSHGRTGLARLLSGSVAEEVLRKATCPVLVVKVPLPQVPSAESGAMAEPGELVDVRPFGSSLVSAHTRTLVQTTALKVARLVVRAGQEIPQHKSKGEVIVHCLEGRVAITALGKTQTLEAGKLLDLPEGEPHALKGIEDASLLLTIVASRR